MDQVKIGAFIAALRREKDWTQEELGERVGVTNKTVSRWENGNYMPSIEILSLLSREFSVSLNELIQGQRLEEAEFRAAADRNLASALERRPFDRFRRWLERNHIAVIIVFLLCVFLVGVCVRLHRYQQAHPVDALTPGTFMYHDWMDSLYLTFDHDGRYYLFNAWGDYLEEGSYVRSGDIITVDNGGSVRWIVVKGWTVYDVSPAGDTLLAYEQTGPGPMFIVKNGDTEHPREH